MKDSTADDAATRDLRIQEMGNELFSGIFVVGLREFPNSLFMNSTEYKFQALDRGRISWWVRRICCVAGLLMLASCLSEFCPKGAWSRAIASPASTGSSYVQGPFYVFVPPNYSENERFGLIVYDPPSNRFLGVPEGWADVLTKHHMLFVALQDAGNNHNSNERQAFAVRAAQMMQRQYKIDHSRIYTSGLSGGARMAGAAAFRHPNLFAGTIQNCGADFYRAVPHRYTDNWTDTNGDPYGVISVPPASIATAKARVHFIFITGPRDFRHGNLYDLYYSGFHQEGFNATLIDVPDMGHQNCSAETLDQALNILGGATQSQPVRRPALR